MSAEDNTTSLVLVEQASAMQVFTTTSELEDIVGKVREIATSEANGLDASTAESRARLKVLAYKVKRSKTYLDGVGKALVDDLKDLPKRVDAHRKLAREALDKLHDEVRAPLTKWEEEQERVKREAAEAERRERERVEAVQRAITGFTQSPLKAIGTTHAYIVGMIDGLESDVPTAEFFGDRFDEAQAAWVEALDKLRHMAEQQEAIETQARIDREREVAEAAARREREAAERRLLDERMATERAQQAQRQAEERAARAEAEAAQRAAEAVERERQRQAEEAERQRAAEAARAANLEHRKAINNRAVNALVTHAGLTIEQARNTVKAVAFGHIHNISITY